MLVPKLVTTLRTYTRAQFTSDLGAGLVVGIVALPLAIAFGIASGVTPQQGLYTAIIGGFIVSALGGSRVQIGGPTGAFVVIVYGVIQQHGLDGLLLATMIAGVILVAMGLLRVGGAIKFIPFPVTTGFTAGIALLIAVQQLRDGLGLQMPSPPAEFVERIGAYLEHAHTWSPYAVAITLGTIAMDRTNNPHSATSQFYINVNDNQPLNFRSPDPGGIGYTPFGKVVQGMDVVDKIAKSPKGGGKPPPPGAPLDPKDVPSTPVIINKALVVDATPAAVSK